MRVLLCMVVGGKYSSSPPAHSLTSTHSHSTPLPLTGTVMSNTYGLAKKATSVAVRVLNDNGSGTTK